MNKEATPRAASHKKWFDELTMELRLHDASGKSIGDALATVQEFLADSGQSPYEAFGTPRAYASQLAAESSRPVKEDLRARITWTAVSLVAFLVFSAALTPWLTGGSLLVGGPQLLSLAVMAALVLTLPLYLAYLVRHVWALVAVPVVGGGAGLLSAVLAPQTRADALLALPPLPVLLISAALLLALSAAGTLMALRETPDPVIGPLEDAAPGTAKARWFEILTQWLFPILALALLGFTALIHAWTL